MRRMLVLSALIALAPLGLAPSAEAHPTSPIVRQERQHQRVVRGARQGELTRGEAIALRRGQAHIAQMRRQAMRDGHMSAGERARIARAQNQLSARIWRLKHNGRTRGA